MMNQIRVLVAEDHALFRHELTAVILRDPRLVIETEASDGELAWRGIVETQPEVVLLDINLPGVTGLEIARRIRRAQIQCLVIVVTGHREKSLVSAVMNLGAKGFVLKDDYVIELPQALRTVLDGGTFISRRIKASPNDSWTSEPGMETSDPGLDDLAPIELRVLQLLAEGNDSDSTGERLVLSGQDIMAIRDRICRKRHLGGEADLLEFARRHQVELRELRLPCRAPA